MALAFILFQESPLTFGRYLATLGVILAQWAPVCGLMYLAVRLGVQHGSRVGIEQAMGITVEEIARQLKAHKDGQ